MGPNSHRPPGAHTNPAKRASPQTSSSWFDRGQNRESGGWGAEQTPYAAEDQGDNGTGEGPAR